MAILEREMEVNGIADAETIEPARRKFNRDDYYAMARIGVLGPEERTELIEGVIFIKGEPKGPDMSPIGAGHVYAVNRMRDALAGAVDQDYAVLTNAPVILDDTSEPEPDLIVALGPMRSYAGALPTARDVVLAVEVSHTTLAFDQRMKQYRFAKSGFPEYWIVNLVDQQIEVYRDAHGDKGYATRIVFAKTDSLAPLFRSEYLIQVSDILP